MDFTALGKIMEYLDNSPRLCRMVWACIGVAGVYVSAVLITAIRWW